MNLKSILQGKCPHCHKAHIFKTFWRMNETCPHCQIRFQRESGYFSMSIFVGYILALIIALPGLLSAIYFLGLVLVLDCGYPEHVCGADRPVDISLCSDLVVARR